mmetsp:Transcript_24561/g.80470  ORF Transcript_24561/g.80470 Transcript_24561/m.80470 type:complete len:311 (-) Transcript_24561:782-1714(-)
MLTFPSLIFTPQTRWILTAAHCVLNAAETQIIPASDSQRVYFGCSDLHSTSYPCQQRIVKEIVANPCFDPCCDYHDIAMLKVDKAMPKEWIGEIDGSRTNIPVPLFPFDISKEKVVMMGWGSTCGDGRCVPSVLQKLEVPVSSMQKCRDVNPVNNGVSSGHCGQAGRCKNLFEYGHVICAGGAMADQGGYDSCNGDSGSPVAWKSNTGWRIVGLVILGSEWPQSDWRCGAVGRHSVLTATAAYVDFVNATISKTSYDCNKKKNTVLSAVSLTGAPSSHAADISTGVFTLCQHHLAGFSCCSTVALLPVKT